MALPVNRTQFLREFDSWWKGLYPGALNLVRGLPRGYIRAALCNTNAIHWPRMTDETDFADAFDHLFPSHLTGKIKPDREAFTHVLDVISCEPSEVFFIDDNELNINAARSIGMKAARAIGIGEAEQALLEAGIIRD